MTDESKFVEATVNAGIKAPSESGNRPPVRSTDESTSKNKDGGD